MTFLKSFKISSNKNSLQQTQFQLLKKIIEEQLPKSSFYNSQLKKYFNDIPRFEKLKDLEKFPLTTKKDLLSCSPYDLLTEQNSIRCHATSGSTGKPLILFYNQKDIDNWSLITARVLSAAGVKKGDKVQISFGYGLFTGGMGFHYGAEKLGAFVIPVGTGNTNKQIELMQKLKTNVLLATPSYANYLAEYIVKNKIKDLSLKKVICGGEPTSKKIKQNVENKLQVNFYENYGLTEMYGPGVAFEIEELARQNKENEIEYLYLNEDYFYPEIIDPKTEKVLPYGEEGELVLTSLQRSAMPIFRYRTGDITHIKVDEEIDKKINQKNIFKNLKSNNLEISTSNLPFCKIAKIKSRCDDMIIVKGVNFYPNQIESVLCDYPKISPIYEIHLLEVNGKDEIHIHLEIDNEQKKDFQNLQQDLAKKIQLVISLQVKIIFHSPYTLKRTEGKRKIVFDERKTN